MAIVKLISWNIARRAAAWRELADSDTDVALLQEATPPPADIAAKVQVDGTAWETSAGRNWRTAVVQLSDRAQVKRIDAKPLADACGGELGVSRPGTLAAAHIMPPLGEPFVAVSVYGAWERVHSITKGDFIYADASVHRLISDLSVFATKRQHQNILVAGDLNVLHGHGEHGDAYWAVGMKPCSAGWRCWDSSLWGRNGRTGGAQSHGRMSFRTRATMFRLTMHGARRQRRVHGNWISCSPQSAVPGACVSERSTSQNPRSGDRAIIA
ncbi:MAG: hypothetical protein WAU90_14355, partial [Methyloceanibacter sp.]